MCFFFGIYCHLRLTELIECMAWCLSLFCKIAIYYHFKYFVPFAVSSFETLVTHILDYLILSHSSFILYWVFLILIPLWGFFISGNSCYVFKLASFYFPQLCPFSDESVTGILHLWHYVLFLAVPFDSTHFSAENSHLLKRLVPFFC